MRACEHDLIASLTDALPDEMDATEALVALGTVTAGVICHTDCQESRSSLVETFCNLLRKSVDLSMH